MGRIRLQEMTMRIIDITRTVEPNMPVWPGDPPVVIERLCNIEEHDCNVSSLCAGLHTGTHIDAPWHYVKEGKKASELDLSRFYGICKVFEIRKEGHIQKEDIKDLDIEQGDIVLFKTENSYIRNEKAFRENYCGLAPDAALELAEKRIKTVGVDYLSVEPFGGNGDVHRILLKNDIAVIEGLDLFEAKSGRYLLSALPLKIEDVDGSPVRAVLIEI
jgi:arylformamidase